MKEYTKKELDIMSKKELAEALRTRRKELDFKLEYVAEKMEVDVPTVSRWENATRLPNILRLIELGKIYNCPIILDQGHVIIKNLSGEDSTHSPKFLYCLNEFLKAYDEEKYKGFQNGNKNPER